MTTSDQLGQTMPEVRVITVNGQPFLKENSYSQILLGYTSYIQAQTSSLNGNTI